MVKERKKGAYEEDSLKCLVEIANRVRVEEKGASPMSELKSTLFSILWSGIQPSLSRSNTVREEDL